MERYGKVESSFITVGRIIDVLAAPRWYNVRINSDIAMSCCDSTSTGSISTYGPSKIGIYSPGSLVLVYIKTTSDLQPEAGIKARLTPPGIIIGSIPGLVDSTKDRIMDWITPFTGADAMNNLAHSGPAQAYGGQYYDFNLTRPMDAVPGSDEGLINEMGVGYGLSRFFSWMRASDMAGAWFFYLDNLTRIAAYNYEFWHAGGERNIKNDQGEVNDVETFTPYPWEALGMLNPNNTSSEEITEDGGVWKPGQTKLWQEPLHADQEIIPRQLIFKGYLGDLHREMIAIPKFSDVDADFVNTRSNSTEEYTGLLDIQKRMDGGYSIRSAKSIHHEKYIFIPVPKRKQLPEQTDDLGDGLTNYKPSGYYGEGTDTLHSKYEWAWSDPERPDTWMAELYDAHAYMFNWYNMKPIIAHVKDYSVPDEGVFPDTEAEQEEGADTPPDARGTYAPEERLSDTFMFPIPDFSEIEVDHRAGASKFYYTRSIISQLDDGSIIIEDGYGSSIHMTGGNIFTSAAGDIWQKPGRCAVTWAGDDIVHKAGSSVDITASNGDLRIKAEKNLHMVGGNSGVTGGIIIESRSVYGVGGEFRFRDDADLPLVGEDVITYGIIVKSASAPVMMYGKDVYVKGVKDLLGVGGDVILDADSDMTISGARYTRLSEDGFTDIIGQTLAAGTAVSGTSIVNRFDKENTVINSTNIFRAAAQYVLLDTVGGAIYAGGSMGLANGVQAYPSLTITNLINNYSANFNAWLTGTGTSDLPVVLANTATLVYGGGIMGDTDFIAQVGFTCRNEEQYGLSDDFWLVESRWQQMYRSKDIGLLWYEPPVKIPGLTDTDITRPHPGNDYWLYYEKFAEYDPELWQWDEGYNVARDPDADPDEDEDASVYDTARRERADEEATALKMRILADTYKVSRQIAGIDAAPTA